MIMKWDKIALVVGGVLAGTVGLKALTSKDAKKAYTHATAAAFRVKECVMTAVTEVKENVGDIVADAKQINEDRAEEVIVDIDPIDDETCECCCNEAENAEEDAEE